MLNPLDDRIAHTSGRFALSTSATMRTVLARESLAPSRMLSSDDSASIFSNRLGSASFSLRRESRLRHRTVIGLPLDLRVREPPRDEAEVQNCLCPSDAVIAARMGTTFLRPFRSMLRRNKR